MPSSVNEGKVNTVRWVKSFPKIKKVLDVGAGRGTYWNLFDDFEVKFDTLDAIEVWKPYIEEYDLVNKYDKVINVDARKHEDWDYDLVIFGDILEHMSKEDALSIWDKVSKQAKYAIISIPIIHYPQGHLFDNPYEEHIKEDWTVEEVLETFDGIREHSIHSIVGVFFAHFDN